MKYQSHFGLGNLDTPNLVVRSERAVTIWTDGIPTPKSGQYPSLKDRKRGALDYLRSAWSCAPCLGECGQIAISVTLGDRDSQGT